MSPCDPLQSVTEPEFLILSQGLGQVTLNLGYLTKSAKCTARKTGADRLSLRGLILIDAFSENLKKIL